jgi:hypothetical protein
MDELRQDGKREMLRYGLSEKRNNVLMRTQDHEDMGVRKGIGDDILIVDAPASSWAWDSQSGLCMTQVMHASELARSCLSMNERHRDGHSE